MTALLQNYLRRKADKQPDAIALTLDNESITYAELEERSNMLARLLQDVGCQRGDRVCMLVPKSPAAVLSMIGVLKADCAYVPVDVSSPASRVQMIISAASPTLILVTQSSSRLLDEVIAMEGPDDVTVGSIEDGPVEGVSFRSAFSATDAITFAGSALDYANASDDPAHILFTSGSTGVPKGVVITHANVIPFIDWAVDYFGIRSSDRISGHPPLHFDLSTFDIYGALSAGAQLHLIPPELGLFPQKLAQLIRDTELTQWFSVPSAMAYMTKFDVIENGDFPMLERVLWCGEALPTPILRHWMERLPHARFTNLYGPTEATIASSYYTVPEIPASDTEPIPIGTPCAGEDLLVLDAERQPTPVGEIGDLYIAGVGLSPGYWRDEENTRTAFVPDQRTPDSSARIYRTGDLARVDADGLVYFLGRADSQIKHRGHRIELGEIETALNTLDLIRECAVVGLDTGDFEGTAICCAYAAAGDGVSPAKVRGELRSMLPSYMLPSRWLVLERLPKNVNGKIDRRQIRETFVEAKENEPAHARA